MDQKQNGSAQTSDAGRVDVGAPSPEAPDDVAEPDILVDTEVPAEDSSEIISTGDLPSPSETRLRVDQAYRKFRSVADGEVASYIPALAQADPDLFGISLVGATGNQYDTGDATTEFSIQSVSKPFVFALVCDAIGHRKARELLGANATGLPFNSVVAVEINADRTMNPMVNAGAIAATSLIPGEYPGQKWSFLRQGLSRFAGRDLMIDPAVYSSESRSNRRNRGVAHLLESYGRMYMDAATATDIYTRQCSLNVTAHDLATMGATLANGGVNPLTGVKVIKPQTCHRVLAVMATAGMYERSGDWLFEVGLPGKSGVSGGMVTVSPGKGGMGIYSPPLDAAGNTVRGTLVTKYLSKRLGMNLFASSPTQPV